MFRLTLIENYARLLDISFAVKSSSDTYMWTF